MKYPRDLQPAPPQIDDEETRQSQEDRQPDPIWGFRDQYQAPKRTSRSVVSPETKDGDFWPKVEW